MWCLSGRHRGEGSDILQEGWRGWVVQGFPTSSKACTGQAWEDWEEIQNGGTACTVVLRVERTAAPLEKPLGSESLRAPNAVEDRTGCAD